MRAAAKRRQRNRRLLYIGAVVGLIVIFVVAAYYLSQPTALDAFDGKAVSVAHMSALASAASAPYANSGSNLEANIRNITGSGLTANGKPVILYIGQEGCPYCAEMRWALVIALMRFGTFTNLSYMTSAYDGTDFPTFTFHGATYQSGYVVLAPYELLDRGTGTVDTLPSNYSAVFNQYSASQGVPFVDYGGKFASPGALLPASIPGYASYLDYLGSLFGSKNWDQVLAAINGVRSGTSNDPLGSLILAGANVITAKICAVTGGNPASVCQQSPVNVLGPTAQSLSLHSAGNSLLVGAADIPRRR